MKQPMFKLMYGRNWTRQDWDGFDILHPSYILFPEAYLHPKDVLDLPFDWIDEHDGTTITIVTHSEHILLRFLQLIRTHNHDLTAEDVEVEWEGAIVGIDKQGRFTAPLKGGFFTERVDTFKEYSPEFLKEVK